MKKLIAAGSGSIFQLGKSFRNGGEQGRNHNPEFTMLEWYQVEADYMDSIDTTERLFDTLASLASSASLAFNDPLTQTPAAQTERLRPPFYRLSVREAFLQHTGIDLLLHPDRKSFAAVARETGLRETADSAAAGGGEEESWEELFNRLLIQYIEPNLPQDRLTVLYDYPAQIPALATACLQGPWLERWELYLGSVEIANCYSEERDPVRIRDFCRRQYAEKTRLATVVPDIDEDFLSIFKTGAGKEGFPRCSGVALGMDRLLMLLAGAESLEGVILFPFSAKV